MFKNVPKLMAHPVEHLLTAVKFRIAKSWIVEYLCVYNLTTFLNFVVYSRIFLAINIVMTLCNVIAFVNSDTVFLAVKKNYYCKVRRHYWSRIFPAWWSWQHFQISVIFSLNFKRTAISWHLRNSSVQLLTQCISAAVVFLRVWRINTKIK